MVRASISSLLRKITVFIVICFFDFSVQGKYGGGTGEPNEPHLVYKAEQMNAIGVVSNDWGKCFQLMEDIDLGQFTAEEYNIIGSNPFI